MKRYPAYDPPEYVDWKPDAGVMKEFRAALAADPRRAAVVDAMTPAKHRALYAGMLRNRLARGFSKCNHRARSYVPSSSQKRSLRYLAAPSQRIVTTTP